MLTAIFLLIISLIIFTVYYINRPEFGKLPANERLKRIEKSPHYQNGAFQNLSKTPQFAENKNIFEIFWGMFTDVAPNKIPEHTLPVNKTDLHTLAADENVLIWMGHSSYYIQLDGTKILVDPVFSGHAGPFSFMNKSFAGSDVYTPKDIPDFDLLLITHDHWDHLDYKTVRELFPKVKKVITGLGTGAHLEYWGLSSAKLIELDWFEKSEIGNNITVHAEPARHFSGRGLKRNAAIWVSFMLQSPSQLIYIGGDSGYDSHFSNIGNRYDSVDLAILETGQYNADWPYIHLMPGEQIKAAKDLKARRILPVHNSKFSLSKHPWSEPLTQIKTQATEIPVLFPKIGEKLDWTAKDLNFDYWWENN